MSPTVTVTARDKAGNTSTKTLSYTVGGGSTLPLVTPMSAKAVHEGYGVCQHVNFQTNNVHIHQAEIMERYGAMNVAQMRSLYVPNLDNFQQAVDGCRAHGVKWNATVAVLGKTTDDQIRSRIKHMAENNADIIGWVEGVNEPNEGTGWAAEAVRVQKVIFEEVHKYPALAHVRVLSPSMHDVRLDNSNGQHWKDFVNAGGAPYVDMVAVHCYPAASTPDTKRAERVQWVYDAFGPGTPIKFTEWGYTTTLGLPKSSRTGGHKVISADAAAVYDCQAVFDFASRGWELLRYEMMDDPDPSNLETEKNFGLWKVQTVTGNPDTTWVAKPSVQHLTSILGWLKDPGPDYTPIPVRLAVSSSSSSLRYHVVQKRSGATRVYLYRYGAVWDPDAEAPITLAKISVTVTDSSGSRVVEVGPQPVAVDIT